MRSFSNCTSSPSIGPIFDEVRALFGRGLRSDIRPQKRWAKWKKPHPR